MPFKSEAQRRKMNQLAEEGKISKKTIDEFNEASKGMKLPEKISKPPRYKSLEDLRKAIKKKGY